MSIESDKIIPPSVIIKQPSFLTKYKNYILIFISLFIVSMTVYFIYKKSTKKEKVDCQLSDWVYNNNCICDNGSPSGYKYKYQSIIKNADNGGISCPSADSLRQKILSCNCSTPSPSSSSTPRPSPSPSSSGSIPSPSPSSSGSTQLNGDIFLYQRYGIGPINLYVRGSNLSVSRNDFSTAAINYKYGPIKYELDSNTFVADYGNGDLQTYVYNPQDNTILEKSTNIIFTTNVAPV